MVYLLLLLSQVSGLNTFKGQVTDPSGAAIPGAVVRIAQAGGKEQRKNTDAAGSFEIRNLAFGKYIVRIEKPGFAAYRIDDLPVSGATVFNIQMSLDAQAQVVNVQSEIQGVTTDPLSNASALVLTAEDLAAFSDDPDALQDELMALAENVSGQSFSESFRWFLHVCWRYCRSRWAADHFS